MTAPLLKHNMLTPAWVGEPRMKWNLAAKKDKTEVHCQHTSLKPPSLFHCLDAIKIGWAGEKTVYNTKTKWTQAQTSSHFVCFYTWNQCCKEQSGHCCWLKCSHFGRHQQFNCIANIGWRSTKRYWTNKFPLTGYYLLATNGTGLCIIQQHRKKNF